MPEEVRAKLREEAGAPKAAPKAAGMSAVFNAAGPGVTWESCGRGDWGVRHGQLEEGGEG